MLLWLPIFYLKIDNFSQQQQLASVERLKPSVSAAAVAVTTAIDENNVTVGNSGIDENDVNLVMEYTNVINAIMVCLFLFT